MSERVTSHWQSSVGPRLLVMAVAVLPVWLLIGTNIADLGYTDRICSFLAGCVYTAALVPLILGDIWRGAPDYEKPVVQDALTVGPIPSQPTGSSQDRATIAPF